MRRVGDRLEHLAVDGAGGRHGQQADARDDVGHRRQRLRHQRAGEPEGAQRGEQRLGRGGARYDHLAVVRIDHAQGAARVGNDVDVRVAEDEAPGLRVVPGRRQHRVADEEGELLARGAVVTGNAPGSMLHACSEGSVVRHCQFSAVQSASSAESMARSPVAEISYNGSGSATAGPKLASLLNGR